VPNSKKIASLCKELSFFDIDPEIVQSITFSLLSPDFCNLIESEERSQ